MINSIPGFGWVISVCINLSLVVPFWFFWTWWGTGEKYFEFLPENFQTIPFDDCVRLFICVSIVKFVLFPVFSVFHYPQFDTKSSE